MAMPIKEIQKWKHKYAIIEHYDNALKYKRIGQNGRKMSPFTWQRKHMIWFNSIYNPILCKVP